MLRQKLPFFCDWMCKVVSICLLESQGHSISLLSGSKPLLFVVQNTKSQLSLSTKFFSQFSFSLESIKSPVFVLEKPTPNSPGGQKHKHASVCELKHRTGSFFLTRARFPSFSVSISCKLSSVHVLVNTSRLIITIVFCNECHSDSDEQQHRTKIVFIFYFLF